VPILKTTQMPEPTFEQIDAHIRSSNIADFESGGRADFTAADVTADPGSAIAKICLAYRAVARCY
jgi:hypothetical protein